MLEVLLTWRVRKIAAHLFPLVAISLPCAGDVRSASRYGILISNTFFDGDRYFSFCFYFLEFWCIKKYKHVSSPCSCLSILVFRVLTTARGNGFSTCIVCDFRSFRCTWSHLKLRNHCAETPCIPIYKGPENGGASSERRQ